VSKKFKAYLGQVQCYQARQQEHPFSGAQAGPWNLM
jgi:hypothetical protein